MESGAGGASTASRTLFEETFMPHCHAAHNLARWLLRDDRDAEDAVQEAFLRAYRAFPRFRGADGKAWFLTIVRHVCFSLLRKRRRHEAEEPFDEELHPPDASCDAEAEAKELQTLRAGLLRRALETLPPEFREMIVLRDLEGLGYKEVAAVTGLPLGTVMSRLSRARDRLRDAALALSKKEKENLA